MLQRLFPNSENRAGTLDDPINAAKKQKQTGQWVAGIFTVLGLAFFIYDLYTVFLIQKGRFDLSDKVLMPVAALMFLVAAGSLVLIQRNHFSIGAGLLFYFYVLVPPVTAVFLLQSIATIAILYIVLLASILIIWVMPISFRRWSILAGVLAVVACSAIEYWNPGFRIATGLGNFAATVIVLAGVLIVGILIRQAALGNIRTKLIISFVLVAVLSVSSVVFFVDRSSRASLTATIGNNLSGLAGGEAVQVAQTLDSELDKLNTLALSKTVQDRAVAGTAADKLSQAEIARLDQEWQAADTTNNNKDPLISNVLNDSLSAELLKYQAKFPENVEVFLTDRPGVSLASTDRTSDYLQSDEDWWQAAYKNGEYIGPPEFDASSKTLAINMAVAVRANGSNLTVGVLRTTVNINSLAGVLQTGLVGKTGQSNIYLPDNQVIKLIGAGTGETGLSVETTNLDIKTLSKASEKYLVSTIDNNPSLLSLASVTILENDAEGKLVNNLGWIIGTNQNQSEALLPVTNQTQSNLILAVIITVLAALAAFVLAQVFANPIIHLNAVAEKVAAGDLSVQAKVETRDETGTLATTFNKMVSQLNSLVTTLEQRVADRTKALATSSEVSRRLSTILDRKQLVKEAVELLQSTFNYYHAHIYLVDETSGDLILAGGTGEAGQTLLSNGHKVIKGKGLVGRAAQTKETIIVPDTSQDPDWLPNPLLPETKSEIAVPILAGERVLGVLDVQNNVVSSLGQQDSDLINAIASQVAVALQNSSLYAAAEASKQEAQLLVDYAPEAIAIVDLVTGFFTDPNENAVKLYGLPREELSKVGPAQMSPPTQPDGRDSTEKAMEKINLAMQGIPPIFEWTHRNASGQDIPCEVRLVRLPGDHPRVRASVTDISERKNIQELARRRTQQQEALNFISQKIQAETTVESALKIAVRELGHALGTQTGVKLKLTTAQDGPVISQNNRAE